MHYFDYHRAASIADAARRLADDPEAKLLAGGMSLIPFLKLRLARTTLLVDLGDLGELRGIAVDGDRLRIGAMTSHATVAASPLAAAAIPALARLAGGIGDPHCRNRGTLGGSLAHADPAACYPSGALALGAAIRTDRRESAAEGFFRGPFETALEPGEILTEVSFPIPRAAAYIKFPQPASRFSLVGVFLARFGDGVRVAVTGAGAHVFRATGLEAALSRDFAPEAIAEVAVPEDGLASDLYGDPEYRAHLIRILTRRAVAECLATGRVDS